MANPGLFDLKSVADLREKLRHDLVEFRAHPTDAYRAYNFFVTAEHLLDWQFPGNKCESTRRNARQCELLLQITSHVANGAKHFVVEAKHHTSVANTDKAQVTDLGLGSACFGEATFGGGHTYTSLLIQLEGNAAAKFGPTVNALNLAEQIFAYWDKQCLSQCSV